MVHRRDDGRIGLLHPPGSPLSGENDIVVPEPSRYDQPIPLAKARDEMDVLGHRFLYFIDAADGRGKVLYLRHDGDYGLVEPRRPAPNVRPDHHPPPGYRRTRLSRSRGRNARALEPERAELGEDVLRTRGR